MRKYILRIFLTVTACSALMAQNNTHDYAEALQKAVYFYGAQRCGDTGNWLLTENEIGQSCHMQDGPDLREGLDLTGGWHDAGDYIKFTLTTAWSAYTLLKAYEIFPESFADHDSQDYSGEPNGIPDILDEVKIATDYLLKVHPDSVTLIARVAGDQDHNNWVTSPYQSTMSVEQGGGVRPVFDNANADIGGIAAAALALMSRIYSEFDEDYALQCLNAAISIYELSLTRPSGTTGTYYQKNSWHDSMLCGAIELFHATENDEYLADAEHYNGQRGRHWWVVDWGNFWDYGRHSLAMADHSQALRVWRQDVDGYLGRISQNEYVKGLAFFGDWASLRYAAGAAFSAALLYEINGEEKYKEFALSQADYILGTNEYERSFVVGFGNNPPQWPHHANAYGREALDWNLSALPVHSLTGAMVGGPTSRAAGVSSAGYEDDIMDYVGNEVTIEYNAVLVGLLAFAVSQTPTSVEKDARIPGQAVFIEPNYPNPFNPSTTIPIVLEQAQNVRLIVYDARGRLIRTIADGFYTQGRHTFTFEAGDLPSGVYFCRMESGTIKQVKKLMLLK